MALDLAAYRTSFRNFIKDYDFLNRLLEFKQENDDNTLDLYLNMSLGFLNSIPPYLGPFTWENFPIPNLIIHQATIECLISNTVVQSRNDLTYNNGGITVKVADGSRYLGALNALYRAAELEMNSLKGIKIAINIQSGWGGISSPYSYLHGRSAVLNPNSILSG
jgi:hypothetical protein